MDPLIISVIVGVIVFVRWLMNYDGNMKPPTSAGGNEEERLRRFLEALGQKPGDAPPSPPPVRRVVPAPGTKQIPLPPRGLRPPPLRVEPPKVPSWFEQEEKKPAPQGALKTEELSRDVQAALRRLESGPVESPLAVDNIWDVKPKKNEVAKAAKVSGTSVRALLSNPAGLRQVIVAQELFGKPVSMR